VEPVLGKTLQRQLQEQVKQVLVAVADMHHPERAVLE
jgi:hypothetical protein